MGYHLPHMVHRDRIRQVTDVAFRGLNHNKQAGDGDFDRMQNMTSDLAPLMAPRKPRWLLRTLTKPNGICCEGGLYWVDGTKFYDGGVQKGTLTDSKKTFATLTPWLIILPDMTAYNKDTGEWKNISESWSGNVKIQDGTYGGEAAEANTIKKPGANFTAKFKVGEAVEISGCTNHPENNKTVVIQEISGTELRFRENTFVIGPAGDNENVTITRPAPDADFMFENGNRLWAGKGDKISCSALGDPFTWERYDDGTADDSWAWETGTPGDFVAGISFKGYACFFKEEFIFKIYGSRPSNFSAEKSATQGVEEGSGQSLAVAGETLYYLSRTGIVAYGGGFPYAIGGALGPDRFKNAVGATDGEKYYVSMQDDAGTWHLFTFDTRFQLWHEEDHTQLVGAGWNKELHFLTADGTMYVPGSAREQPEGSTAEGQVESFAETADFTYDPNKKHIAKLLLRAELEAGSELVIKMSFDGGAFEQEAKLTGDEKRSWYLPIIPRRCDRFRIRFEGKGPWVLYSLCKEIAPGSQM